MGTRADRPGDVAELLGLARVDALDVAAATEMVTRLRPLYGHPVRLPAEARPEDIFAAVEEWERRVAELVRLLNEALGEVWKLVLVQPQRAVPLAQAASLAAGLLDDPRIHGLVAFGLAHSLRSAGRPEEAAIHAEAAVGAFAGHPEDTLREADARLELVRALGEAARYEDAIRASDDLLTVVGDRGQAGFAAEGLRLRGVALADAGRPDAALASLREAVATRRELDEAVAEEQSTGDLDEYLAQLGGTSREVGAFSEALSAFSEAVALAELDEDKGRLAYLISEEAFTHHAAGNDLRAAELLERAALVGATAGGSLDAERWSLGAAMMRGELGSSDLESQEKVVVDSPSSAYLVNARAVRLLALERFDHAAALAEEVLAWSRVEHDRHLEASALNTIGVRELRRGRPKKAIATLRQAIKVTSASGQRTMQPGITYNLAKAFYELPDLTAAFEVAIYGLAQASDVLARSDELAIRQQVLAGQLGLWELLALIAGQARGTERLLLLETERVRAPAMSSWLRAAASLERADLAASVRTDALAALAEVRAAETELDALAAAPARASSEARRVARAARESSVERLDAAMRAAGLPQLYKASGPDDQWTSLDELLASAATPGSVVLSLMSIPEGVTWALLHRGEPGVDIESGFVDFDRHERLAALAAFSGDRRFGGGGSAAGAFSRDMMQQQSGATDPVDELVGVLRERLVEPLLERVRAVGGRHLAVIPHRELALVPWWPLVDEVPSIETLTLAPSLYALSLCEQRVRDERGPGLLLGDVTRTLTHAPEELAHIASVRPATRAVSSISELRNRAPTCAVLHVAAHGLYDPEDPYGSGVVVAGTDDVAAGSFARWASWPPLAVSAAPGAAQASVLTVGECLTRLELTQCRLAVLSSCESGLARPHGGGELIGLPASLLVAGAKTVIASLWPVHDAAAALMMRCFYEAWSGGAGREPSVARALATARGRLRQCSRATALSLLGLDASLPPGEHPFARSTYTNAFQCWGAV